MCKFDDIDFVSGDVCLCALMSVFIQHVWYGSDFEQHHGSLNVFSLENRVAKVCHTLYKKTKIIIIIIIIIIMTVCCC